jgi:transcriptional regulator with XRE-family HTH domain
MSIYSNLAFGWRLRAHRERRGLTVAALADTLKTKQSLLEQLERDDVTRWPPGIYGRALVREYAKLVDLPPDEIVQQFVLLSAAGDEQRDTGSGRKRHDTADVLRLTFADVSAPTPELLYRRVLAATVELFVVLTIGLVVAFVSGSRGSTTNAIIALIWYPARTAIWGSDALYRMLRLRRPSGSFSWPHATERAAADSADDPFIVDTDVNAATSSSTVVH